MGAATGRARWWFAAAIAAAAAFVAIFIAVSPVAHADALDLDVATWVAAHRTSSWIAAAKAASLAGSVVSIVPLALVIAYLLHRRHGWNHARWYVLAIAGATGIYLVINNLIDRDRPPMGLRLIEDSAWSFPSGHSTQAIAFCFGTALLVAHGRPVRTKLLACSGALLVALAIGGSRICLGAHWTTDVAGGFALGTCWLATVLALRSAVHGE
jgi:undecaprenyl-diphosphatase